LFCAVSDHFHFDCSIIYCYFCCLLFATDQFSTIELRTTSVCPGGPEAERSIQRFKANDDTFHCLPAGELAWKVLTDKWVFPGDPEFDTQIIRIEMKGVKK